MLAPLMAPLTLEIVEGPGAGQQVSLDRPLVVGRQDDADVVLADGQVSRHHARVSPATDGSAVVEDLGSANGTFVNGNELHGPARLDPGDELLIGVTLMEIRSQQQVISQPSAVRAVPPGLAAPQRDPTYVNPAVVAAEVGGGVAETQGEHALDKWRDVRVKRQAQLAPLALFTLVALSLILYFVTR